MMVLDVVDDNDDDFNDDFDNDNDNNDDNAINRWPFIGIDLGTMLSADFAAAAVLIRFPTLKLCCLPQIINQN